MRRSTRPSRCRAERVPARAAPNLLNQIATPDTLLGKLAGCVALESMPSPVKTPPDGLVALAIERIRNRRRAPDPVPPCDPTQGRRMSTKPAQTDDKAGGRRRKMSTAPTQPGWRGRSQKAQNKQTYRASAACVRARALFPFLDNQAALLIAEVVPFWDRRIVSAL